MNDSNFLSCLTRVCLCLVENIEEIISKEVKNGNEIKDKRKESENKKENSNKINKFEKPVEKTVIRSNIGSGNENYVRIGTKNVRETSNKDKNKNEIIRETFPRDSKSGTSGSTAKEHVRDGTGQQLKSEIRLDTGNNNLEMEEKNLGKTNRCRTDQPSEDRYVKADDKNDDAYDMKTKVSTGNVSAEMTMTNDDEVMDSRKINASKNVRKEITWSDVVKGLSSKRDITSNLINLK